jgi:iron complex transport system ATP-binding protein
VTPVLETNDLAVGRAGGVVLAGVNLAVAAGERFALVGANGCGKTTLLRALAGLDPVLAGTIHWRGMALPRGAARVRTLGVVFQTEQASHFTVREMVTLGLALDAPPSASARARIDHVLRTAELTALAERACATLSGGELQRVVLARATVAEPALLLLDEPTNHLDPARQAMLLGELDRLRDRVAVVMATHDLALAAGCDRVALIHAGRIAALGTASEVLTPAALRRALGVDVQRVDDPTGGPPMLRVLPAEVAA